MENHSSSKKSMTDWEHLAAMPDSAIDFTEIPELGASFFENAELRLPKREHGLHSADKEGQGEQHGLGESIERRP